MATSHPLARFVRTKLPKASYPLKDCQHYLATSVPPDRSVTDIVVHIAAARRYLRLDNYAEAKFRQRRRQGVIKAALTRRANKAAS